MRTIDANAFANVLRNDKKYMRLLMSKETAPVDVLSTVIVDLEGTGLDGYKNAPTVSAEPKWIPISEQMPKKAGNYLVTDHKGDIARYIFLDSESSKDYWMRCVKAWMPLPKPYKEGD